MAEEQAGQTENKNATRAMWLGVTSVLCFGITGVPAVIFGILALKGQNPRGRSKAIMGLLLGGFSCLLWAGTYISGLVNERQQAAAAAENDRLVAEKVRAAAPTKIQDARAALAAKNTDALNTAVRWLRMNKQEVPADIGLPFAEAKLSKANELFAKAKLDEAISTARGAMDVATAVDPRLTELIAKIEAVPVFDGTAVLGATRSKVHTILGTPTGEDADTDYAGRPWDKYRLRGSRVTVLFDGSKGGSKAVRLSVGKGIARDKVNLPTSDAFKLAGVDYAVTDLKEDGFLFSRVDFENAEEKRAAAQAEADERQLRLAKEKKTVDERKEAAQTMEYNMLKAGMEARVRSTGPNNTTMNIVWIGCGRSALVQLLEGSSWGISGRDKLRALGFKKLQCSDGYSSVTSANIE